MLRVSSLQLGLTAALAFAAVPASQVQAATDNVVIPMVVSPGAAGCLPRAFGRATISSIGAAENLHLEVGGLPANAAFDFFIIQVPNKPFGLSWYQGDVQTDSHGLGVGDFVGRFNIETFIVAPGVAPAPAVFKNQPFPDATSNPATPPVQIAHLGLWFNSPNTAAKVGCGGQVTPFNGTHNAGIQVLNTGSFPDTGGPLLSVH